MIIREPQTLECTVTIETLAGAALLAAIVVEQRQKQGEPADYVHGVEAVWKSRRLLRAEKISGEFGHGVRLTWRLGLEQASRFTEKLIVAIVATSPDIFACDTEANLAARAVADAEAGM